MATETNEPRALATALATPAAQQFATRGAGMAMHAAERHVERWAPEAGANRVRPLRSLGFVDRLIAPWIETAQRSASLRLFNQYAMTGTSERAGGAVSWVFPRPWYQDELDWMAAARHAPQQAAAFTTRGTYVTPTLPAREREPMPPALYEYVAPSLSVASRSADGGASTPSPFAMPSGIDFDASGGRRLDASGGRRASDSSFDPGASARFANVVGARAVRSEAYSPLVPLAAVQAADVMARTLQRLPSAGGVTALDRSPALRNVLAAMLARLAASPSTPLGISMQAPELVTPPAPRADVAPEQATQVSPALHVAERFAEERARIAEVQRIARRSAERELAPAAAAAPGPAPTTTDVATATAARAEAEVRQRAATLAVARSEAERAASVASDRERTEKAVEERIARRTAERTTVQRLHEQSRAEAAAHARAAIPAAPARTTDTVEPAIVERHAPAEVVAAIAALPPELATYLARRGEPTKAIAELNEAYRTVELLARSAAAGEPFQSVRGPRLMMPVGLGGLVAAVDQSHHVQTMITSPVARPIAPPMIAPRPELRDARVPATSWIAPRAMTAITPTSALGAAAATAPAALGHVAWADCWLARFAGASQPSLDAFAAQAPMSRFEGFQALAAAAPGAVFVSPSYFDIENATSDCPAAPRFAPIVDDARITAPTPGAPAPSVVRFDDDAETPDDVFAAIPEAASRGRATAAIAPAARVSAPAAASIERLTQADVIAHAAPAAPTAGFAAQLASSPFAAALRHVLSLPSAPTFDVRSLFGGALSATYLAGLLAPESREVDVAGRSVPTWASWAPTSAADADAPSIGERAAPSWDAAYVAPDDSGERATPTSVEGDLAEARAQAFAAAAPLTTLRTALLAYEHTAVAFDATRDAVVPSAPHGAARATSSMIQAMSMPMLGDVAHADAGGESWVSPGMVGERARAWSFAQERSSADLAFDFVTPELVLAARVYGLGPVEAAQAARLAIAGPGQLSAMASTVDRTFAQAIAPAGERIAAETDRRRAARAAVETAFPLPSGEVAAYVAPSDARAGKVEVEVEAERFEARRAAAGGASFGVERRAPRGAFLWPAATVAALKLDAAGPDGEQAMPLAALELIAAQAVAELGTFALLGDAAPIAGDVGDTAGAPLAFGDRAPASAGGDRAPEASRSPSMTLPAESAEPAEADVLGTAVSLVPAARRARFEALYLALGQSPAGRTWSPAARAARALALSGRGEDAPASAYERAMAAWDVLPVVYAMDAVGESVSAGGAVASPAGTRMSRRAAMAPTTRSIADGAWRRADGAWVDGAEPSFAHSPQIDGRPGLGALSARAGEALGSYVAPSAPPASSTSSSGGFGAPGREVGAVLRAPTAAQEMVQTGRTSGRFGGGEVEIPTWFEAAARKMFESQSSSLGDGISMAELTLIAATPQTQIAASTRTAPAAGPITPATAQGGPQKGEQVDVEKLANEIYRQILVMMDVARARNGEPYL